MVLSKRERFIAMATISTVALLLLYTMLISPLMEDRSTLDDKIRDARLEKTNGTNAVKRAERERPLWNDRIKGPIKANTTDAQTQLINSVVAWGKQAGMTALSITQQDRSDKEKDFSKIAVRATARSTMRQLTTFMFDIQNAKIPLRITELTVTAPKEGTDDVTVQMSISSIFLVPEPETKPGAPIAAREGTP